jgi:hypothetical protein
MVDHWQQTFSGVQFDLENPQPPMVRIEDIAHALARISRYGGHAKCEHYSVAEHSVLGARQLGGELAFQFLMHDAHEAYTGDVILPVKRMLGDAWHEFENRVSKVVRERFDLPEKLDPKVKEADMRMLETERRAIIGPSPAPWGTENFKPYVWAEPRCWPPHIAEIYFLEAYHDLAL